MSLPARRVVAAVAVLVAAELAFARLLHIGVDETVFAVASAVLFAVGMALVRLWLVPIEQLRHARAELARLAVVDERLRFARDLHDLLGHGLSAMAVKSERAGRLLARDPGRARREIGDVERLARVALGDIREVVAGYRSPSLGEELDGAREILAAAGIACTVSVPDRPLPQPL